MIRFSQIEDIVGGKVLQRTNDDDIETLSIDSRKTASARHALFLAIRGERHDGHDYISSLFASGIRNFIVEHEITTHHLPGANVIAVQSSVTALQQIAAFHRNSFTIPVIGITGSNGKTIIKEWLYQMLSPDKVTIKNPGSYNSQVGVPLSVWLIRPYHELGLFEAGISRPGEMEKLERVIRPTIGIFSNIGSAHDEGFATRALKIDEKLKLFAHAEVVIYCRDHAAIHKPISRTAVRTFSWGTADDCDMIVHYAPASVQITFGEKECVLDTSSLDRAATENVLHCIAAMLWLGYELPGIQKRVADLRAIPMRLELKEGINHCQVIDDTYNNDLGSLEIALHFLSSQQQKRTRRVILSDILESGLDDTRLADAIAAAIMDHQVHALICIGPAMERNKEKFPASTQFYSDTDAFLREFDFSTPENEIILVKGARKFAFERIVARLQRKVHGTVVEIDLAALVHNLNYFKSLLKPATKVMVMVKAFAYGSGSIEIANLLQYHQVDYLGVAYADEGVDLRKNNISLPVMVMNPSEESFEAMVKYQLEPEVYSIRILQSLITFLNGATCRVHVKIDTGMNRLGFSASDLPVLKKLLHAHSNIQVATIFSHLAGADDATHDAFSQQQYDTFNAIAGSIDAVIGYRPLRHILNTSGILRLSGFQLDMARLGIGLYGVDPTAASHPLKTAVTLKTIISQIKHVASGETIGYGRRGRAERETSTATIALGYADGYSRAFSRGVGKVLINGHLAPVIGNVCMDMTMVDITGIPAREGDEVIVFGKELPVQELADSIHSIPYEILTSTSERVRRVFIADGV